MEHVEGEIMNISNEYRSYKEYKAAVDAELRKSAEGFVRIGYLLKVARDTDILKESGYNSVNEFAEAEYSLDKSQVSRFIRINDEYSEGGYSDKLQDRYKSFGYAKLALMLLLPPAVNEELTADYTKSEIQAVKDEIDEEKKRTDIEVMLEEKDGRQQEYGLFTKVLYQIGRDQPEIYVALYNAVTDTVNDGTDTPVINKMVDTLAPAGEAIISVRIAGEGKKLLSIRGSSRDPVIVDVRSEERTVCSWDDFISAMEDLCQEDDARKNWESLYGQEFPGKKEEVAPVQPGQKPKQTPGRPQRVIRSGPEKMKKERSIKQMGRAVSRSKRKPGRKGMISNRMLQTRRRQQSKTIQAAYRLTTMQMRLNPATLHLEPVMETGTERQMGEMMRTLETSRRQQDREKQTDS